MTQRDSRISLTDDERETLEMVLDFSLERLAEEHNWSAASMFAKRLARCKIMRLKLKLFPQPKQKEPST